MTDTERNELIERGKNAQKLLDSEFFAKTIQALKQHACDQLCKTAPDDARGRELLHAQMLNWNLCNDTLKKWSQTANYLIDGERAVPEA